MKGELQRHKKSDGIKWFATLLAVILLATAVTAAITKGFKDWNPYGWFDKKQETPAPSPSDTPSAGVIDGNGNELPGGQVHNMPARMTFRSAASLSSSAEYSEVTIQATVKPVEATNKAVDWSVAFKNPASSWATGKTVTDYVTVTPQADGSTTAKVKCLKDFGEQIKITVTSRMNPSVKADCAVDFMKRVKDVDVQYFATGDNGAPQTFTLATTRIDFVNTVFDGVGTLSGSSVYTDFTVDEEIPVKYQLSGVSENLALCSTAVGIELGARTRELSTQIFTFLGDVLSGPGMNELTVAQKNSVVDWMRSNPNKPLFCFEVNIGGTNARDVQIPIYFSTAGLVKMVETVELNNSTIII